jgi:NAD-dependent deacetylase sirtuin 2
METSMILLLSSEGGYPNVDVNDVVVDDDDMLLDSGGLVAPKSDCPHIASHVKFRVVNGEMRLLLLQEQEKEEDGGEDEEEEDRGVRQKFQRLHLSTPSAIMNAYCQHYQCAGRRANHINNNRRKKKKKKNNNADNDNGDEELLPAGGGDNAAITDCNDDANHIDNENRGNGEVEDDEYNDDGLAVVVGENWLCLECGLLHCSRYQFGHAKWHYESTKEQQQRQVLQQQKQKQTGQDDKSSDIDAAVEKGEAKKERMGGGEYYNNSSLLPPPPLASTATATATAEGHCIAVSMADLSVWCYECNAYLRHPTLHELTNHLEGLKFGSSTTSHSSGDTSGDQNVAGADGMMNVEAEEEGGEDGGEEANEGNANEIMLNDENDEEVKEDDYDEEDKMNDEQHRCSDAKNDASQPTTAMPSNEQPHPQGQSHNHRESSILSSSSSAASSSSSFNNSTTTHKKRKGQPPKRRAPDQDSHTNNDRDWSYQKFKPGDEHVGSDDRVANNTGKHGDDNDDDDIHNSSEEDDEEKEIAAIIESQHGEMLRAYLARHDSYYDTSNMGQCVPILHMPKPPSFPDEVADYLRSPLCKSIIVLAGAGMSVSCGIPDFRSVGVGLYDTLRPELLTASDEERELIERDPAIALHKHLFLQNPLPMLETKRSFILGTHTKKWKATLAHRFVELLHTKLGKLTRLYTQNIDGLELQTAIPKKKVVNVHGTMGAAACELCGHTMDFDTFCGMVRSNIKDITGEDGDAPSKSTPIYCGACGEPTVKPDIVLFAGSLPKKFYKRTADDLPEADLLIVMGTSLSVAPANSLVYRVPSTALRLVMNNEPVGRRLGIDYSDSAIRDVWAHGSTDLSCLNLAEQMGWLDDLALVMDELPDKSARLLRERLAQRKEKEEEKEDDEIDDDEEEETTSV